MTIWLTANCSEFAGRKSVTFHGNSGGRRISTSSRGPGDTRGFSEDVLLFVECDAKLNTAKARLYGLSEPAGKALASWQYKLYWGTGANHGRQMVSYNIVVRSKEGSVICVVPLSLSYHYLMPIAHTAVGNARTAIIAPLTGITAYCYSQFVDCKVPKGELPNVASITIELAE